MLKRLKTRPESGFTLVELMVVVLVIAVLIAIAIPTFLGARERAQNRTAQANLQTATKAESAYNASDATSGFTANAVIMAAEESSLDWTGGATDSIHVSVADVVAGDSQQLLVYTRSGTGTWYGLRVVTQNGVGINAGRYTCEGVAEANVDDMADCTGNDW